MSIKLVMLKSGEDIIADVKEIKTEQDVIGYFFHDPLIVKMYSPEEPVVLSEENGVESDYGTTKEISSKVGVTFYPWVPLSAENKIPCSADWVITMVEPMQNLKKLYQEKIDGRNKDNQSPVVV
tara:strand:- start:225 stop:596 length:372 start_codon:yes stop_codon:yes gene_type:complete